MKLIFYKEAADHLKTTPDSIAHAVRRGSLTRAGHKGKNSLLIEEQVLLFKGERNGRKKWISLQDLTPSEKREWDRYAREAQAREAGGAGKDEIRAIVQAEVDQREEQLEEAFAGFLMQMGQLFKNGIMPRVRSEAQKSEAPQGANFTMAS